MASLTLILWRDIPAQVVVKRGREAAKVKLSARFEQAIDRAAMRAGIDAGATFDRNSALPMTVYTIPLGGAARGAA